MAMTGATPVAGFCRPLSLPRVGRVARHIAPGNRQNQLGRPAQSGEQSNWTDGKETQWARAAKVAEMEPPQGFGILDDDEWTVGMKCEQYNVVDKSTTEMGEIVSKGRSGHWLDSDTLITFKRQNGEMYTLNVTRLKPTVRLYY
jgi:hypothetical protein